MYIWKALNVVISCTMLKLNYAMQLILDRLKEKCLDNGMQLPEWIETQWKEWTMRPQNQNVTISQKLAQDSIQHCWILSKIGARILHSYAPSMKALYCLKLKDGSKDKTWQDEYRTVVLLMFDISQWWVAPGCGSCSALPTACNRYFHSWLESSMPEPPFAMKIPLKPWTP